jgi:hypothetical protein
MKGSPAKARVVYAPVLEVGGEGRLALACSILCILSSDEELLSSVSIYCKSCRLSKKQLCLLDVM